MKKKIIFAIPIFQTGGTERVLVNIVHALKNDYDITVIIKQKPTKCDLLDRLYSLKVPVFCLVEKFPNIVKPKKFFKKLYWKLFIKKKAFNESFHFINSLCDKDTLWIDFLCFTFFNYTKKLPANIEKWSWMHCSSDVFLQKKNLAKISAYQKIISINNTFTQEVKSHLPDLPIKTLLNPVDIEEIYKQSLSKISTKEEFFVYVGRISQDKDVATLIQAYKIFLSNTNSKTKLLLIGTGEKVEYYKEMVQNLDLSDKVIFKGNLSNPFPWMRQSKALILSSLSEGSPMVLLEAMISETIPVSSDCVSGPKEMLASGKRGLLFKPKDANELALIMQKIDSGMMTKKQFQPYWKDFIQMHSFTQFKKNFEGVIDEKN